ncbi:hypothetical protein CTheo_4513 [Ceratobasidium theobromae]|uniref:Elongation factor Ts, mitochondrial n=1 Tax=Ceratobasidium theobromae TaxID=1582974 RepID=A0A5N5QKQ5_9AGAM|nr:hypothetical protein CTheo_4513 [Ceratobasidium theobromae]
MLVATDHIGNSLLKFIRLDLFSAYIHSPDMINMLRRATSGMRAFHTSRSCTTELKASIKLIAEIRKITDNQVPFGKAKDALLATNNNLNAALEWLEQDNITSGAKKVAKVASRTANDGLVGITVLADGSFAHSKQATFVRAAMVEVNCETDFVAKNEIFSNLVADIAHTTAYLAEASAPTNDPTQLNLIRPFPVQLLTDAPLIRAPSGSGSFSPNPSNTISSAIQNATSKLGEKISLRRACSFVTAPSLGTLRAGSYLHLSTPQTQTGKIGALVAVSLKSNSNISKSLDADVRTLVRSLARQVVGLGADRVQAPSLAELGDPSSSALYAQPFMMRPGGGTDLSVRFALNAWAEEKGLVVPSQSTSGDVNDGVHVVEFVKWSAGEGIEKPEEEEQVQSCQVRVMDAERTSLAPEHPPNSVY